MKHTAPSKTAGRKYTGLLSQFMWLIGCLSVLVLLTGTLFSVRFFRNTLVTTVQELEADYLHVQTRNVESLLHRYTSKVYEAAVDTQLLDYARTLSRSGSDAAVIRDLRTYLWRCISTDVTYVAATLAFDNGEYCTASRLHDNHALVSWLSSVSMPSYDQALQDLCRRAAEKGGIAVGVRPDRRERSPVRFFHLACPVYDLLTRQRYATMVLTVSTASLAETVNPQRTEQGISTGMLVAQDGTVLCHSSQSMVGERLEDDPHFAAQKLVWSAQTNLLDLTVYRIADEQLLMSRAQRELVGQGLTVILLTMGGLVLTLLMMHSMSRSTRSLLKGIERMGHGEHAVHVPVTDKHEIGQITQAFNHLSAQLEQSRRREEEHAAKTLEALGRQHKAEMQALERQINAHFLYNTLNTINYTAIESGSQEVSQQIHFLANILRYSFENCHDVVTPAQVMAWLEDYLTLQRLRYGKSFDFSGFVDESVHDWPMRKLLIQPFVENALLHGFSGQQYGCMLQIRFQPFKDDRMRVTITDTGRGLPKHQVELLNRFFRGEVEQLPGAGVGLANARQRLEMFYGGKSSVFFRSSESIQTVVTLLLPRYEDKG